MIISDTLRKEMEQDIAQYQNCVDAEQADGFVDVMTAQYANKSSEFVQIFLLASSLNNPLKKLRFILGSFKSMLWKSEEELTQSASRQEENANRPQQLKTDAPLSVAGTVVGLQEMANAMTRFQGTNVPSVAAGTGKPRVFIVHGHDDAAKLEVALTLQRAGFEPIILHEQASNGKTIIEKIEKYTDVCYAVVLYTPCDLGRAKENTQERPRARQNVVFEHGYLIAKLKRNRVCALVKDGVETPGDMSGVVYIPMGNDGGWKLKLATEMNAVGLNFDLNTLL